MFPTAKLHNKFAFAVWCYNFLLKMSFLMKKICGVKKTP